MQTVISHQKLIPASSIDGTSVNVTFVAVFVCVCFCYLFFSLHNKAVTYSAIQGTEVYFFPISHTYLPCVSFGER